MMFPCFTINRLIQTFFLILLSLIAIAKNSPEYDVNKIDASLLEGAHVIVRADHSKFQVSDEGKATLQVHKVITVLNEQGTSLVPVYVYIDPKRHLKNLSGNIYNASGQLLRAISSEDFRDFPVAQAAPLFEQYRLSVFAYTISQYPYTIDYRYEVEIDEFYQYPVWSPVRSEHISVEEASFSLEIPVGHDFHYKSVKLQEKPEVNRYRERTIYSWRVKNFPSLEVEALGPDLSEITPNLLLSPDTFTYEGVTGTADDWQSFGKWVYQLQLGNDTLPEEIKRQVRALAASTPDLKKKVKALYDYLHAHARYVDIPLGIGTYQPLSPARVAEVGYGDSKALSHYMKALLQVVDVTSHLALVNAGEFAADLDTGFAGPHFSRAILMVPLGKDTLWLDFSDPQKPMGFTGYELSGREALIITEKGGALLKIPAYAPGLNLQSRNGTIKIKNDGQAEAEIVTQYSGLQYEHVSAVLLLGPHQQEEVIYRKTTAEDFSLNAYSFSASQEENPVLEEKLNISLTDFAKPTGSRLYFIPNLMNQMDGLPHFTGERTQPLEIKRSFVDTDTLIYLLPNVLQLSRIPEEVNIKSEFGEYRMSARMENHNLIYTRYLMTYSGKFPASAYERMVEFFEDVVRADQRVVVLQSANLHMKKERLLKPSTLQ